MNFKRSAHYYQREGSAQHGTTSPHRNSIIVLNWIKCSRSQGFELGLSFDSLNRIFVLKNRALLTVFLCEDFEVDAVELAAHVVGGLAAFGDEVVKI